MANGSRLVDLVQTRIEDFLADRSSILLDIAPDLGAPMEFSRRFLSGGKRFRARFCHAGWRAAVGSADLDLSPIVAAAAALELFHAAALVHDDLIDNSDTRRGAPSAHRLFERLHADSGWNGDAGEYGRASAILLGDLILGWSDELLDGGLSLLADRASARAARAEFMRMRTEVAAGQYLDILEERAWSTRGEHAQRELAERVVVYKSAKYSIVAPLRIGAAIGGASAAQQDALGEFGLPLGIAFQLRDDLLGVYGDPEVTGKPAGDDLREGKRTMLVAIARERLDAGRRRTLDDLLGDPGLTAAQVAMLQQTIAGSGAVDELESIITSHLERAYAALDRAPVDDRAKAELRALGASVTRRSS